MFRIKRTYEPPQSSDGGRVFVERLWPRGTKKSELAADVWMKELAPSPELRRWFSHEPRRWQGFVRRYREELNEKPDAWRPLLEAGRRGTVTLLYSARDQMHNAARALCEYLQEQHARLPPKARRAATARPRVPHG